MLSNYNIKYICTIYTRLFTCLTPIPKFALREKVTLRLLKLLFKGVDVVEWSRAMDVIKVSHIEVNKNISFIQRGVLQITIVILDANSYAENLIQEIHDNLTYEAVPTDLMRKIENKVKKLANEMFKHGFITKDMKHYLVNSDVKLGNLQANPKVHKSGIPLRTIVNVGKYGGNC